MLTFHVKLYIKQSFENGIQFESFKAMDLKIQLLKQQHQHYLGTFKKYKFLASTQELKNKKFCRYDPGFFFLSSLPGIMGFAGGSAGKVSVCNGGDPFPSLSCEDTLEKEMATHSSTLAWKIPWMEEPGGL